jgi:hypothetical protein
MTYAQLTIIAEAAAKAVTDTDPGHDSQYAVYNAVYNATIEAGKEFVRPLYPIYEVD